jgi:soluble lytic murein transglycosylase-like protein
VYEVVREPIETFKAATAGSQLLNRHPGRKFIRFLLCLFGILAAWGIMPSTPRADIYKLIDENGVIHFSNVPTAKGNWKLIIKEKRVHFNLGPNFTRFDPLILKAAKKYNVDYALVKAVIKAESNFNPRAISRVGAIGLMQLMPETADFLKVSDSFHPGDNIDGGVRYLRYLLNLFNGNLPLSLAAYNAGEKAVFRYNGIPPYRETQTYVRRVQQYYREFSGESKNPVQSVRSSN